MLGYKLDFVRTNFKRSFQILNHFCCKEKALFFQKLNEPINYLHHCQFVSLNCLPNLILWYCKRFLEESPLIFIYSSINLCNVISLLSKYGIKCQLINATLVKRRKFSNWNIHEDKSGSYLIQDLINWFTSISRLL